MITQTAPEKLKPVLPESKEATLVIGAGLVGRALSNVLSSAYSVYLRDKVDEMKDAFRVINICYEYSDSFVEITRNYINQYRPELTIIHSTVSPGTTKELGIGVVHSPINGRHPHLEEAIKKFKKPIGGNDIYSIFQAANFLNEAGITTMVFSNSTVTEWAKLLCTTYYGWNLVYMKEVARICDEAGLPFSEVYTIWNALYNRGYTELGETKFLRPVLDPIEGPIGGHCVIPNCDLIDDFLTQTIKGRNELYKLDKSLNKNAKPTRKKKT